MNVRRFRYLEQDWEAFQSAGPGAALSYLPEADARVGLRSVSHPERGEFRTSAAWTGLSAMTDLDLARLLESALTVAAIDRSRYVWRTAEGIAKETGIELPRVRAYLATSSDAAVLESEEPDPDGRVLYTTQDHFVRSLSSNGFVKVDPT